MAVTALVRNRAFRKIVQSPYGNVAVCAKVVLTTYVDSIQGLIGKMLMTRTLAQEAITLLPKRILCPN